MRILFATMPFDGHFNPLTGIAVHLREQGHDVRWYAGPSYTSKLESLGIPVFPFQRAQEVNGENIADLFPERQKLKGFKLISFDAEQIFVANVENHYRDIADIHAEFPFDAMFCDTAFYAMRLVKDKLGVRIYAVGVMPLFATSRDVPPLFFGFRPARTPLGKVIHRGARAVVNSGFRASVRRYNQVLAAEGLEPVAYDALLNIPHQTAHRFFQSGSPGLDYPRSDLPENVAYVGALLPHKTVTVSDPPYLDRVRAAERPVVVVSQGTVDNKDLGKLIVPTLEALKDGPYLVAVTTGGIETDQLRRRYPQENVMIEDFLDFDVLFPHTAVFVCNGGYGSVLLALTHGVPLVTAGQREGKSDINARLAHLGYGIDLRTERAKPGKIAAAVGRVRSGESFRRRAADASRELASYSPYDLIDRALAEDAPGESRAVPAEDAGRAGRGS